MNNKNSTVDLKPALTYLPNLSEFNKVLIILREPGGRNKNEDTPSSKEALKSNQEWYTALIESDNYKDGSASQFRNRFKEMLTYCGNASLNETAYTNLRQQHGGTKASKEYWNLFKEKHNQYSEYATDAEEILWYIIEKVNPKTVFVLKEVFNIVSAGHEHEVDYKHGILYQNGKRLRMVRVDGKTYYEIYHPCYRSKVISQIRT